MVDSNLYVLHPVGADSEDVDIVFEDIINLLTHIVLDDNLVYKARSLNSLDTLQDIVANIELTTLPVEAIIRNAHDKVVAQGLCSA